MWCCQGGENPSDVAIVAGRGINDDWRTRRELKGQNLSLPLRNRFAVGVQLLKTHQGIATEKVSVLLSSIVWLHLRKVK